MRRYIIALPLLIASLLVACSTTTHSQPARRRMVVVDEHDNGSTVTLHEGDTLIRRLDNTYWHIATPQAGDVLTIVDRMVRPAPLNAGRCVPGQGCGSVVAKFHAEHAGHVQVLASRTTCGEAMGYTKSQSHYDLALVVD